MIKTSDIVVLTGLFIFPLTMLAIHLALIFIRAYPMKFLKLKSKLQEYYKYTVVVQEPKQLLALRQLRNDDTCSICLIESKVYEVSLQCSHSFCGLCVLKVTEQEPSRKIKCPLCRVHTTRVFKCFDKKQHQSRSPCSSSLSGQISTNSPLSQNQTIIIQKIKEYNKRFDSSRTIVKIFNRLPIQFDKLYEALFAGNYLVIAIRSVYVLRFFFIIALYVLSPFIKVSATTAGILRHLDQLLVLGIVAFSKFHKRRH